MNASPRNDSSHEQGEEIKSQSQAKEEIQAQAASRAGLCPAIAGDGGEGYRGETEIAKSRACYQNNAVNLSPIIILIWAAFLSCHASWLGDTGSTPNGVPNRGSSSFPSLPNCQLNFSVGIGTFFSTILAHSNSDLINASYISCAAATVCGLEPCLVPTVGNCIYSPRYSDLTRHWRTSHFKSPQLKAISLAKRCGSASVLVKITSTLCQPQAFSFSISGENILGAPLANCSYSKRLRSSAICPALIFKSWFSFVNWAVCNFSCSDSFANSSDCWVIPAISTSANPIVAAPPTNSKAKPTNSNIVPITPIRSLALSSFGFFKTCTLSSMQPAINTMPVPMISEGSQNAMECLNIQPDIQYARIRNAIAARQRTVYIMLINAAICVLIAIALLSKSKKP